MSKMVTRPKVQEQCIYKRKRRKDTSNPYYIPHINTPPNKMSYTNSPPSMTTLISKTTSPFCHE